MAANRVLRNALPTGLIAKLSIPYGISEICRKFIADSSPFAYITLCLQDNREQREEHQPMKSSGGEATTATRSGRKLYPIVGGIVAIGVAALLVWFLEWYIAPKDIGQRKDFVQTLAQIFGGAFVLVSLYFAWRTLQNNRQTSEDNRQATQTTLELSRASQTTERFTNAIEQLGDDKLAIRLGGIYALERIARDSEEYHVPIIEVLSAYVRERARWGLKLVLQDASQPWEDLVTRSPDIQAILSVLARRDPVPGAEIGLGQYAPVDLGFTDLRGADFKKGHFEQANLYGARLESASLAETHLEGANLDNAHLEGAYLEGAALRGAYLGNTHLEGTILRGVDLQETIGLSKEQIELAVGDGTTLLPENLEEHRPKWWSRVLYNEYLPPEERLLISLHDYALSFSVGADWIAQRMSPDFLQISQERSTVTFMRPWKVYNPQGPSEGNVLPAPDDFVSWFETHQYIRTLETDSVILQGIQGKQIDAVVSHVPKSSPEGMPVVPVFYFRDGFPFFLYDGYKNRMVVLDVEGERIVIVLESPAEEFDRFIDEQANKMLDTLQWESP
jgi:hypothetical protein